MTGALIALLLFPLAGCAFGRRPFSEAFLLGVGLVGAALFVGGVIGAPFPLTLAVVLIAGVVGISQSLSRRERGAEGGVRGHAFATALTIAPLFVLTFIAAITPLTDFDGRAFWLLKAKALAHERTIDGPFFHNEVVFSPRNQYPLLIPLDAATIMSLARDSDDHQVRFLYLGIFAALAFHLRRRVGAWCAALFVWLPQFAISDAAGALTAYNDLAIAAFVACAFFELMDGERPLLFGLWLSFLALTKSEGLPLAIILAVIGAFTSRRRLVIALAPLAIAVVALVAWRSGIPPTDEEQFLSRLPLLPQHLDRLLPAIGGLLRHAIAPNVWGFFWIAAIVALTLLAVRREWRPAAVVVSVAAMYVAAYAVSVWILDDLIDASVDRLLMHVAAPALFAISASVRNR
ncbi:MAG: hypothetical protein JWO97_4121 [Acidobacteria bacterium]|nr:hypothetical protein [Acidobacteriota bacterium]